MLAYSISETYIYIMFQFQTIYNVPIVAIEMLQITITLCYYSKVIVMYLVIKSCATSSLTKSYNYLMNS